VSQHRGIVAAILASALGIVLIIIAVAVALGVEVKELTRDAAIAAVGALAGGLVTYLART
jgi:hypothetical protein